VQVSVRTDRTLVEVIDGESEACYSNRSFGSNEVKTSGILVAVGIFIAVLSSATLRAETAGRVTGIGGVFVTSKDPKALAKWYKEVLGIAIEPWGGQCLSLKP
jgi:hypothetical protein